LVTGNVSAGVILTDLNGFQPEGNEVRGNVVEGNGTDLVAVSSGGSVTINGRKNCFSENRFATSNPATIERALPCGVLVDGEVPVGAYRPATAPPDVDYRSVALPGPQLSMPDAANLPATVVDGRPPTIDLAVIVVPKAA
jgi:hypothetical protein